ncbi:hypothetical protein NMY22_g9160 [Coprinellus aureogranulatus]|nr:hypothetical protein NMY22_g9160 [Coprinellus aureogranulatus]
MAKRKVSESEEESAEYSEEHSSDSAPKSKSKGKAKQRVVPTAKKPTKKQLDSESESKSSSEDERPVAKKPKRQVRFRVCHAHGSSPLNRLFQANGSPSGVNVLKNKDGEQYIDLGKKKHATVRMFKGMQLLDIREYYDAGGEEKPGKKGISLTLEQWKALKAAADTIDKLFQDAKK